MHKTSRVEPKYMMFCRLAFQVLLRQLYL